MLLILLLACRAPSTDPLPQPEDAPVFAAPGQPIPGLDAATLEAFERGRTVMKRGFRTDEGLGPTFNADRCSACHQVPEVGGSAPRYRDFWLVRRPRWDGTMEDVGSNGVSPVRNLYATAPDFHIPEPADTSLYARRNAPSGLGVGLFAFIEDQAILNLADPDDIDGDGISGRANYEQGRVGRFGVKSQASRLESFNRGAMLNQMGITSNPLLYTIPGEPQDGASMGALVPLQPLWLWSSTAHAQVSAAGEPTTDDDAVPDPEMNDDDQLDLLIFSTFLAAPPAGAPGPDEEAGSELFTQVGCDDCHVPRLDSRLGPLRAYTDLLVHDMGEELADGIGAGLATGAEFRTGPLWGVGLHAPYLHDGRAQTLAEAIELHGGEGEASREAWRDLSTAEQDQLLAFLRMLGDGESDGQVLATGEVPAVGEAGGPGRTLDADRAAAFERGRRIFDRSVPAEEGLGTYFNADSCRACHQHPALGGAGAIDTNVLRIGARDEDGLYAPLELNVLPRSVVDGHDPMRLPEGATLVELRQPPSAFGLGLLGQVPEETILAGEDLEDLDLDGITGRARILADGRVGRFGWKAQIGSLGDFAADALLNENGLTIDPSLSTFTRADDDELADPELPTDAYADLVAYLDELAPPLAKGQDPDGAALFEETGCAECHLPELGGVPAYTDLLLHEVAPVPLVLVEQDDGLLPGEYRTPPLWGIGETAPYLHDGSAPTLEASILDGHAAEAQGSREAYEALSVEDKERLLGFLGTI